MKLENDDIVISGVGGCFPKAQNIEQLKEHLYKSETLLSSRWKDGERGCTNKIGTIQTQHFDNAYFGIHRQQCTYMDPMQRLVLERTFEALIDAGVNPSEVKGRRIGCFMGSCVGENDNLFLESVISGFGVTGHSRAMMPNRISYWLNLKGPSVAYDSNWISGIEVIRLAYDAIRSGQCEAVIVGTANLALNSEFQFLYNDMGVLSPDGSTKPFDIDAKGYARSDGVVVLYIQKASEAKRQYASIVNVSTMFNGNREGSFCEIDVPSMVNFIDEFYKKSGVDPCNVDFVEAYGCGVKETDVKELAALEQVYCKNRKHPLLVGSIKPHTGHSEATSALFSVVKVLIAMENQKIPATLQYENPNPEIAALKNGNIKVIDENTEWNGEYAAVNGIGLNSYYGHILLKSNPKKAIVKPDDLPRLVIASTRTESGIKEMLDLIKSRPELNNEYIGLIQDLFAKPILGHLYRGYTVLGIEDTKQESEYHLGNRRQIWFVYSGMGSQWAGMVGDLLKIPVFAEAINKCHKILEPKGVDLMHIISTTDKTIFDNILHSFVGIAAIQIGLTEVLRAVGIVPDGIIGHSVGELGCAYADGAMTAEQMILSAYSRGRASLEATLVKGMMAAIGMGYTQIKDKCPPTIEVACHNGPDSSTISGPTEDMEKFVQELQDQGIFARLVNVANIAYHSRYIKPAAPKLLEYLKQVLPEPIERSAKWISTSNLEENWTTDLAKHSSAEYHTNNLLSQVLFEEGLKHIPKDSVLIEIAPHGLLQAILKRSLKPGCTNVPLTQRGAKSGVEFLLTSLGKLYLSGLDMNIHNLYPKIEYPVSKGTPCLANLVHWEHSETWRTGLEDKLNAHLYGVRDINFTLNSEEFRECVGNQIDEKIIVPSSSYLNIISNIIQSVSTSHKEIVFENLFFKKVLAIPKVGSVPIHAMIQKGSGEFEILANNEIVMSGKMTFPLPSDKFMLDDDELETGDDNVQLSGSDVYNEFQHRGQKFTGVYKTIKSLTQTEEGSVGVIQWNNKWYLFLEAMIQQHLIQAGEKYQDIQVPKTIQKIAISESDLPTDKTDLKVNYNYSTGIISTKGIQIIGLRSTHFPREERAISYDSVEFFPLVNSSTNNFDTCLNAALQLTIDNFHEENNVSVMITEIETKNESLLQYATNVLKEYKKINPNVTSVKDTKQIMIQQNYPSLFIYNDTIKEDVAKITASCNAFLLVRSDSSTHPSVVQVAQFVVNGIQYSIVRKANPVEPIVVTVKGDTLSIKDISRGSVSWVTELASAATAAQTGQSVFLISSIMPTEGIVNFVQEIRSLPYLTNVRVLFNLDKRINEINTKDAVYKQIFKQDLILSVFKDNFFGTYIHIPTAIKENISNNQTIISNAIKNKTIHYISPNLKDETLNPATNVKNELGNIDYSAVTSTGERVMGIAHLDPDTFKLVPDDILNWTAPEEWSLADAATIPHAYACAAYALFHKADLKPGETVLIHAGCSAIGMAAISLASYHACTVYTTVSTDWQRAYLKKQYVFLKDRNILSSDNGSFEPQLLVATGGLGAHVILNCLSGSLLQASVTCLADYGRFIQYGKYDLEENNCIGMNFFLRNTSFHVVNFDNILVAHNEVKEEIKAHVAKGIVSASVRPFIRKVVDHQEINVILDTLKKSSNVGKILIKITNSITMNKFNVDQPNQFICDGKSSYLVYGGSADLWTDLTEWLILRGARKIVVSSDTKPQQTHVNRRLSLLQSYFGADIVFAPSKAHTREGAAELLSEVYFLGPIHGVFLLPSKSNVTRSSDSKPVQYIDLALRTTAPKALFVNFINNAAGICQLRADAGFTTFNIQNQKELDFTDSLFALDEILNMKVKNVLIKNDKVNENVQESAQELFKKLTLLLPTSLEEVIEQTSLSPKKGSLIQLTTLGPRFIRELAPVFIIPGISGHKELKEFAFNLLYPTYCVALPDQHVPIKELAADLIKQIKVIWPKGPYNFIALSSGGALAMEIARILDKENASVHIYFMDSAPSTLQSSLKHLGENEIDFEVNLLFRLFNNNDAAHVKKLKELPNWKSRVTSALNAYDGQLTDRDLLLRGLETLKDRLQDIVNLHPTEELISATTHLIRPSTSNRHDNCGLLSYCKQTPQITLVEGNHLSIITNKDTSEYINKTLSLI